MAAYCMLTASMKRFGVLFLVLVACAVTLSAQAKRIFTNKAEPYFKTLFPNAGGFSDFGGTPLHYKVYGVDPKTNPNAPPIGFIFWTFTLIAGAIWAESAWGRYWGWDPKETWAFITWVAYAAYLHARVTVGWRGRRAAWLCLFAGSTFLFNYVYVNIWGTGKHTYSGL
mgnify:CR=1 FL=1